MQVTIIANPLLPEALALRGEIAVRLEALGIAHADTVTEQTELVITVGGDGTVLRNADCGRPILGVHAGSVGFLTEIDKGELDLLARLASGDYRVEERMQIQGLFRGTPRASSLTKAITVLNEIALVATPEDWGRRCVNITASVDGNTFAEYRGDGLIFSTPTGSTGYSLSAGGAVLDPALEAVLLTPLYCHTLGAKPLVFSPEAALSVVSRETLSVSADGGEPLTLPAGESLTIRRAEEAVRFVRLKDVSFAARLGKLR